MLALQQSDYQAVERRWHIRADMLSDGTRVTVKPARSSDIGLIQEMHARLSRESLRLRYLAPRAPTPEALQRLCFLDGRTGAALVATVQEPQEKVIAVACFGVYPHDPTTAEPAVLVEDWYQGRGVGKRVLLALCEQAREMGVETFECFTHVANHCVLHLVEGSGLRYESRCGRGVREFRVWLNPQ